MKSIILSSLIALVALFTVSSATAQSPKLRAPLQVNTDNNILEVCFDISGLGNVSEVTILLDATATVTTQCRNRGGNVAPGQTTTQQIPTVSRTFPVSNGRAQGCIDTREVEFTPGSCPPGFGDGAEITSVTFSDATLTVVGRKNTVFRVPL
jgi:hypothetical protein